MKTCFTTFVIVVISVFFSIYTLGNSIEDGSSNLQDKRVVIPCSGAEYSSDRSYFRATGTASNRNPRTAERMARLDANANLAANISVTIESVTDRYIAEVQVDDETEMTERFEDLARTVADQELSNVNIVCSETVYENDRYTIYIAVEMPREDVLNSVKEAESHISETESSPLFYEKKAFEKIFDEEMERLEKK